jgi:uncharacterized protein (TIGR02646 family)
VIRVQRGAPPGDAQLVEQNSLVQARQRHARGLTVRRNEDLPDTYRRWSGQLSEQQHHKCCYCETVEQTSRNDVEHYRPAGSAQRTKQLGDPGYWWLAYSWANLLFSCAPCNQSGKNDWFSLEPGSVALAPEDAPPGQERPVLLDPTVDHPLDHIKFAPVAVAGAPERWHPVALSRRGHENIMLLKLDRPGLLDLYGGHVRNMVEPLLGPAQRGQLPRAWLCDYLLAPAMPFTALSAWVLSERLGSDFVAEAKRRGC